MIKYMFIIPSLSFGGAERVISVLSTAVTDQDREVVVIKYFDTHNEYPLGSKVKVINLSGGNEDAYHKIGFLRKISLLREIIISEKPDVVIPYLFHVSLHTGLACIGLNKFVAQSIRNDPRNSPTSKVKRFIRDWIIYRSKCTFVQNKKQRDYFRKISRNKIHVLFNPISEDMFQRQPQSDSDMFTVIGVGRLSPQKNFTLLIDAFIRAFKEEIDTQLRIYGDGVEMARLEQYVNKKNLHGRIRLMGRIDNIKEIYEKANLFVLSSNYEGLPNALIEAMALGLPCVATDCPTGPSELIEDGNTGILVPVRDVEAMANAIKELYGDESRAKKMGINARKEIQTKCSSEVIARKLTSVCEECIKELNRC